MIESLSVEAVATLLTKAQIKALRAASATRFKLGTTILRHAKLRRWPSRPNYREFSFCWEYGKPDHLGFVHFRRLNPIGVAVREYIDSKMKGH